MNIPMLDQDKANHYLWGTVAATVSRAVAAFIFPQYGIPPAAAAMAGSTAVGLMKEVIDLVINKMAVKRGERAPHTVDPADILWTAAGGIPVAAAPPWM